MALVVRLLRAARRFRQDRSGAAAVEFALVAMPMLITILFILIVGYTLIAAQGLDYATHKAARQIMIGNVQTAGLTADQFRTQNICPFLPPLMNCNDVIVTAQSVNTTSSGANYGSFLNANWSWIIIPTLSNAGAPFCTGVSGTYIVLEVFYPLPILLGVFANAGVTVSYNGSSRLLLTSTATFKNEPFAGGTAC